MKVVRSLRLQAHLPNCQMRAMREGIAEGQMKQQVLAKQIRSEITGIPNKTAYDLQLKKAPEGRLRCVYGIG